MDRLLPTLAPTGSPSKPEITSFNATSVTLVWLPPAFEETNGVIRFYTISVQERETSLKLEIPSHFLNTTVNHLHPYYTYSFKVRAETVDPGPYSAETSIQLEESGAGLTFSTHTTYRTQGVNLT